MHIVNTAARFSFVRLSPVYNPIRRRRRYFIIGANLLPFPKHKAKYHKELESAIDAVDRACRLCVDVKKSLFSSTEKILEKNDQTPVTIADFGVQALVSLELSKQFPLIPLVAEEDSVSVRADNNIVSSVVSEVKAKASVGDKPLSDADVLEAIDRGGKDAFVFCDKPATYWVYTTFYQSQFQRVFIRVLVQILDPIDGTKGFLKGDEALYVAWDHAVGIICVNEAGGKVTDWEGDEIILDEDKSERRNIFPAGGFVGSNESLHHQILELISSSSSTL
ncbi:unnamed protein product [Cochlearia groenlandica]